MDNQPVHAHVCPYQIMVCTSHKAQEHKTNSALHVAIGACMSPHEGILCCQNACCGCDGGINAVRRLYNHVHVHVTRHKRSVH